jgi:hypothetical protein
MGHDLPRELWPVFVDGIERTAARAAASADRDRVVGEIG